MTPIPRACPLFVLIMTIQVAAAEQAEHEWVRWRGPNGNSITDESGWRPEALLPQPKIRWRAQVGVGYSALCVKGDRVWTMGNRDKQDSVYCLSNKDGSEIWRHTYPCDDGAFSGPRATPVYDNARLYTVSREGHLFCFRAYTGEILWEKNLVTEANAENRRWGIATSCVIEGDQLLVNVGRYGLSLNKETGAIIWQSPKAPTGFASSVIYELGGRRCIANFGQKAIYGVDATTGELLWTQPWVTKLDENSADPVVSGSRVFVSSIYNRGCMVFDIADNTPRKIWVNRSLENKFSTSVLYQSHLYGVNGNTARKTSKTKGILTCLDWETGDTRWTHDTGVASLIIADGKLVVLNEKGLLRIAEATPERYRELAWAKVLQGGEADRYAKGKCWTAPVLCAGNIYCRDDKGNIVCIDMR